MRILACEVYHPADYPNSADDFGNSGLYFRVQEAEKEAYWVPRRGIGVVML